MATKKIKVVKKRIQNAWHDFTNSLFKLIVESGGELLTDIVTAAVKEVEVAGGSGKWKFNTAYDKIVAALTERGLPIIGNAISGAIEAAVANLKAK